MVSEIGLAVQDLFEAWIAGLFLLVIGADLYLGRSDRRLRVFAVVQTLWLVGGYLLAIRQVRAQGIEGPWIWGHVIGVWVIAVLGVHLVVLVARR